MYFQKIREEFEKNPAPNIHYQQCLKNGKKVLDNDGSCGALLVDLSKDFSSIVHDFLLANLSANGFHYNSLKLINSFLGDRKFKMKIGSYYSPYLDLLVGIPQGTILGVLCFLIYTCAIFFYVIANLISLTTRTKLPFMLVNQILTLY